MGHIVLSTETGSSLELVGLVVAVAVAAAEVVAAGAGVVAFAAFVA